MELRHRLRAITSAVPQCQCVADIGTDHALVPIFLAENQRADRILACDIVEGPVQVAEKNIREAGFSGRISLRMGDGLDPVSPGEAEVIVIAGMGGMVMSSILERGLATAKAAERLILQPMSDVEKLRRWLGSNGFDVFDEILVMDAGKIYSVMSVRYTGKIQVPEGPDLHIGARLVEKRDPLLAVMLHKKIRQMNRILSLTSASEEDLTGIREESLQLKKAFEALLKDIPEHGHHKSVNTQEVPGK